MEFFECFDLEHKNLSDAIEAVARKQPAAPAIHVPGRLSLTYGDLGAQVRYVRERLGSWGIAPGDIVAGVIPSRAEMAVVCATLPSCCTFAPLGPNLTMDAYAQLIVRMGARAVLLPQGHEHPIRKAARQYGVAEIDVISEPDAPAGLFTLNLRQRGSSLRATPTGRRELAYIVTSSGTTGQPKLVPSPHRQLLLYASAVRDWLAYTPQDVGCHLSPIHLGNGLRSGLLIPLLAGMSIVCLPESDVDAFFTSIEEFQLTCLNASPTLLRAILRRAPEYHQVLQQSRFRFLRSGAGRLHPEEIDRIEEAIGTPVLVAFSSTEAAAISHDPLPPRQRKRGAAGLPLLNHVAVMDASGRICANQETGQLVVRGPLVFPGYLDDPDLTAASFAGEWFCTGDLGSIDEEGYVHVSGRIKEIINRGGEKISPVEVDDAIESLPGVKEAATFGVPHASLGEEVVAALVRQADSSLDEAQVIEHVRRRVGSTKAPRKIYFVEQLPRTGNGKVLRRELRQQLGLEQSGGTAKPGSGPAAGATPLSPLEGALAGLWASLLKVSSVGRDDNFFLLGGDSLHGAQVIAHVKTLFGVELPLQSLFGEAATVAGMARAIEALRQASAATQEHTPPATVQSAVSPIHRREVRDHVVLTHAQWRLWFLARLDPGSATYNESRAHRLTGPLDVEALHRSLRLLVQRHEVLRTTFTVIDDEPRQIVHDDGVLDFERLDLSLVSASGREESLSSLLTKVTQEPFDLESGPLARFRLIRLEEQEHVLLRVWHHIISDGWSAGIFERELSGAYGALVKGRSVELPALPLQYADYAEWQREWLSDELLGAQLRYWKQHLANVPALNLPADHRRPAVQTYRGASVEMALPPALASALKELTRTEGATLFMVLLAAFSALLSRHSRQEEIAVGTPVAHRNRAEFEGIIGLFATTLVLRIDLFGDPSVREMIRRTKEVVLSGLAHQDVPFEKVVEELKPERSLSHNPLFQVFFALQNTPDEGMQLPGLVATRFKPAHGTAKFDISFLFVESPKGLQGRLEYNADLFDQATVERMLEHYRVLLEGAVANPQLRLSELPLLGADELQRVVVGFNNTSADYPQGFCIHDFVAQQAARTPEALALVGEKERITYRELNAKANQIAHFLMKHGAGPDVPVGIYCERSAHLVAGILGILKAGSAYVPLDPNYPKERLRYILEDAKAPIVLTQASLADELPDFGGRRICLDGEWDSIARESEENPATEVWPDNLAYVLFTSGSTGRPKGVALEHRNAANLIRWAKDVFSPEELAGVLFSTSVCFDLSVFELFVTLSAGGRIILAPDVLRLPTLATKNEVTLINTVPSAMAELVRTGGIAESVKTVNLAGEPLPETLVEQIYATTNVEKINNLYGPTETCTYATYTPVRRGRPVTIGKPIANTRVYVLDARRNPAPIGVVGELYIAGDGVARGYLNHTELTFERFIPDPFDRESGGRLYTTGDLGRLLPDGNVDFRGRVDNQVKIRGFRIELGEIEAVLTQHAAVEANAVIGHEETAGGRRLVAYVVFRAGQAADAGELRAFLKLKLPDYMLPSQFVVLERLPYLPTGKVDRSALPAPERVGSLDRGQVGPRNQLEYQLVKIWEELLGVGSIGIRDDFFELGGNSLLAVRLMLRIEQVYCKKLDVSVLFACATVEHLADAIGQQTEEQIAPALIKVQPHGSQTPFFFLHGDYMGGGVYCLKLARYLGDEQPFYALQPLGLDGCGLPPTVESMAETYLKILRVARPHGPYLLGGYCFGGLVAFEMARRLLAEGEAVDLIVIEAHASNVNFRTLDKLVACASVLLRLDPTERRDCFLGLRRLAIEFRALPSVKRRAIFLWENVRKLKSPPKWVAQVLRTDLRRSSVVTRPGGGRKSAADWECFVEEKQEHYRRVTSGHVAHPYPGRLTLIRAAERRRPDDDPYLGWRNVASEVDLHVIPGNHDTCMTEFLDSAAERLKCCLEHLSARSACPR
jgi:amino acid adenylation domain-containing protein